MNWPGVFLRDYWTLSSLILLQCNPFVTLVLRRVYLFFFFFFFSVTVIVVVGFEVDDFSFTFIFTLLPTRHVAWRGTGALSSSLLSSFYYLPPLVVVFVTVSIVLILNE